MLTRDQISRYQEHGFLAVEKVLPLEEGATGELVLTHLLLQQGVGLVEFGIALFQHLRHPVQGYSESSKLAFAFGQ